MLLRCRVCAALKGEGQAGALEIWDWGSGRSRRRSEGLLKFAETYANLNKITTLNLKKVYARDLFETCMC